MNLAFARNSYNRVKSEAVSNRKDAYEAVSFAMDQVIKSMEMLQKDILISEKEFHFERSLTCLYFLQKCLDFKNGGELASNLFKVYEHCRQSILKTKLIDNSTSPNLNNKNEIDLNSPIKFMRTISDGWEGIRAEVIK